jgi:periplasmic protein CpxP/Spy
MTGKGGRLCRPLSFSVERNFFKEPSMKNIIQLSMLTLAIPSLLTASIAMAEPADTTAEKQKPASVEPKKCDYWKGEEKRLESLKADLKLTANQEAAWTEWAGKIKADKKGWETKRKEVESWSNLPVPVRMEKMLAFSKEHIATQEAHLEATKIFYAKLSLDQRKIFDKEFNFEHHDRPGKHWKK